MTNPNRPQYEDTIASTWGQAVADTVVRRYATTAARDADVAGLTLAALTGQVIVIVPGGGSIPYLQVHDGTAWRNLGANARLYRAAGFAAVASVSTPYPFDTISYDNSGGGAKVPPGNFTVPIAGLYRVSGSYEMAGTVAGNLYLSTILKNGGGQSENRQYSPPGGGAMSMPVNDTVKCIAGDILGMAYWCQTGVAMGVGSSTCYMAIDRVGN